MNQLLRLIRNLRDAIERHSPAERERREIIDHIERFERATEGKLSALRRKADDREDRHKEA